MSQMSMPEFARRFRLAFPDLGSANLFLDRVLSAATLNPHLDTMALDEAITAKHGEYAGSLSDFVTEHYGATATAFVREAI